MFPTLVTEFIKPLNAGGRIARDGMEVFISPRWSDFLKTTTFTVGLYIHESVFENSVDSLKCFMTYMDSPWYPVADGGTLEEAFQKLEEKLQMAVSFGDLDEWYQRVFSPAFKFTECESRDARYEFDPHQYKLFEPLTKESK